MLTLVQFAPIWGVPSPSPFCVKVETYLRMANLEYRVERLGDPRKSPKGKLPFIKDKGKKIADSELILTYLQETYRTNLDNELSASDKAKATLIKRLCEDHLYWALVYSRWQDDSFWPQVKKAFFKDLPVLLRPIVSELARKSALTALHGQGFGRHAADIVYEKGRQDIEALAVVLGENAYMLGSSVTTVDASVYGVLANILFSPLKSPLQQTLIGQKQLVAYCERIRSAYFSDV